MALNREGIYTALLAKLAAVSGLGTAGASRSFRDYNQLRPEEQPAIFLVTGPEAAEWASPGQPPKWKLRPTVYVYVRTDPEGGAVPGTTLNTLVSAIESALAWAPADGGFGAPGGSTTLGGLCLYVRILSVDYGEGVADGQGIAQLNLEVFAFGGA